ncbi:MAG: acyl transferase [Flavobacteriaceae bacterium]
MNGAAFNQNIFSLNSSAQFEQAALELFSYQYEHNRVYSSFCDLLNIFPEEVTSLEKIPFLPISFFKTHEVRCLQEKPEKIFYSSATTGQVPSRHFVYDLALYEKSFQSAFHQFYGNPEEYAILALLPSYLERGNSSLVYMAQHLIQHSAHPLSGFYLNEWEALEQTLSSLEQKKQKTILLGVSFALLDFIEKHPLLLEHTIIMETGGMKGRRTELVRDALHERLKKGFGVQAIHSEYGMTELLSQAYALKNGRFKTPPWMQVQVRSTEDPFEILEVGRTGALNIIDLANRDSCAFIATQDLGKKHPDHSFEVLGRFDHAEIRGCNLMVL